MRNRLIIEGNAVYEIDEECMKRKQGQGPGKSYPGKNPLASPGQEKNREAQRL